MRKLYSSLIVLFAFPIICLSQSVDSTDIKAPWEYNYLTDTGIGARVNLHYLIQNNSNVINNKVIVNFLTGKSIGSGIREKILLSVRKKNRIGYDEIGGAEFSIFRNPENKGTALFLKLQRRTHIDVGFTGDLFRLATGGNKQFAGKTIDFGGSSINYSIYDQLGIGMARQIRKWKSASFFYSASLYILGGYRNVTAAAPRGTIFTQQDGEYIDADFKFLFQGTDFTSSNLPQLFKYNGSGVAADLGFGIQGNNFSLFLEIKDAGMIGWRKNTSMYSKDTAWRFDGINIENLITFFDNGYPNLDDTLSRYAEPNQSKDPYTSYTPARMSLETAFRTGKRGFLLAGANHQLYSNYTPQIHAGYKHYFTSFAAFTADAVLGGYGTFDLNVSFAKQFPRGYFMLLECRGAEALLSFDNTSGFGIMARAGKYFGKKNSKPHLRQAY